MGAAETQAMENGGLQIYITNCLQGRSWRRDPRQSTDCGETRLRFWKRAGDQTAQMKKRWLVWGRPMCGIVSSKLRRREV